MFCAIFSIVKPLLLHANVTRFALLLISRADKAFPLQSSEVNVGHKLMSMDVNVLVVQFNAVTAPCIVVVPADKVNSAGNSV